MAKESRTIPDRLNELLALSGFRVLCLPGLLDDQHDSALSVKRLLQNIFTGLLSPAHSTVCFALLCPALSGFKLVLVVVVRFDDLMLPVTALFVSSDPFAVCWAFSSIVIGIFCIARWNLV